jgi:hypothetical protein
MLPCYHAESHGGIWSCSCPVLFFVPAGKYLSGTNSLIVVSSLGVLPFQSGVPRVPPTELEAPRCAQHPNSDARLHPHGNPTSAYPADVGRGHSRPVTRLEPSEGTPCDQPSRPITRRRGWPRPPTRPRADPRGDRGTRGACLPRALPGHLPGRGLDPASRPLTRPGTEGPQRPGGLLLVRRRPLPPRPLRHARLPGAAPPGS